MRKSMKAQPQIESLESLALLSGMAAVMHPSHAEVATGTTLTLGGSERGVFLAERSSTATTYTIFAAGRLTPIGATTIRGNLHVLSGISSGPPDGTLHLSTRRGSLTLQIPETVVLPAGLPTATGPHEIVDTYLITGGTGAYQGDTGSGVVEFRFSGANASAMGSRVGRVQITFTTLLPPTTTSATS
jgi:hypothetical protein